MNWNDIVNKLTQRTSSWPLERLSKNFINRYGVIYSPDKSLEDNLKQLSDEDVLDFLAWTNYMERPFDLRINFTRWKEQTEDIYG